MFIELNECPQKFIDAVESELALDKHCELVNIHKYEVRVHTDKSMITFDYVATIKCVTMFIILKYTIYPTGLEIESKGYISFRDIKNLVNNCEDLQKYLSF